MLLGCRSQVARLWRSINDHERALENYKKACKSLSEKQLAKLVGTEDRSLVAEQQRLRVRDV